MQQHCRAQLSRIVGQSTVTLQGIGPTSACRVPRGVIASPDPFMLHACCVRAVVFALPKAHSRGDSLVDLID